ncbi:MAG: hypothetical protein GY817_00005 [bacterium]|nr:hypothetical protein [bacterium]
MNIIDRVVIDNVNYGLSELGCLTQQSQDLACIFDAERAGLITDVLSCGELVVNFGDYAFIHPIDPHGIRRT